MGTLIENVRLSYVSILEPRPNKAGVPKYSASVMIAEDNVKALETVKAAIETAMDKAVESGALKEVQRSIVISPVRSGTDEYNMEKKDATYNGYYFFNAYSDNQPGLVDNKVHPIVNPDEIYSGIWAVVDVNFYFTKKGGDPRVAVGLNHILKLRDDDRLDGRTNVQDAFAKYVEKLSRGEDLT